MNIVPRAAIAAVLMVLSCSALAQQKAAEPKKAGPKPIWITVDDRGEMKWVQGPKVWPELIVLRLNAAQVKKFGSDPTGYLNDPEPLFSKKVNKMSADCVKRAKDYGPTADVYFVIVAHDPGSTSCPAVLAHPKESGKDEKPPKVAK